MALTYTDSNALMNDFDFRGRIKVAALHYADYIMNEATNTPGHTSRLRWASATFQSPDQAAQSLHSPVVMDPAVQADGAAIIDTNLQSAVENTINKLI